MSNERMGMQRLIVCNLSARGIGARTKGLVPLEGEEVTVALGQASGLIARVRWVRASRFGLHLRDNIDPQLFALVPQQLSSDISEPPHHVCDRFRPVEKAWRPGVRSR